MMLVGGPWACASQNKTNSTRFMVIDQNQVAVASLIDLNCHIHPGYFWIWYDASCSKKQLVVAFCQMFSGTFHLNC